MPTMACERYLCQSYNFCQSVPVTLFILSTSVSLRTADAFPVVASLPRKNSVCEPERQNDFHDVKSFVLMLVKQIKGLAQRSDSSRPRALKCLGFWPELPNTHWNVNFTTITRLPATLNSDFFMKQLLVKLCMLCGPGFAY